MSLRCEDHRILLELPAKVADGGTAVGLAECIDDLFFGEFRPLHRSTPFVEDRRSRHSTLVLECRRFRGRRHHEYVSDGDRFQGLRRRDLKIKWAGQRAAIEPRDLGRSWLNVGARLRIGQRQRSEGRLGASYTGQPGKFLLVCCGGLREVGIVSRQVLNRRARSAPHWRRYTKITFHTLSPVHLD